MIDNNVSANKSALNLHKWFKGDPVIWSISIMLSLLSILCVYSASGSLAYRQMHGNTEYYLIKHSALIIASFVVMWITHNIDYRYYTGLSDIVLWISVPLLIITWRYGIKLNEASRWLNIPFINKSFQPSDLAQLALIANLAKMLSKSQKNIDNPKKGLVPMLLWCITICGLISLANFSAALLLFLTYVLMMYIGRVPIKQIILFLSIGSIIVSLFMLSGQRYTTITSRLYSFATGKTSFQTKQSYIAIATGGICGKGPGNSTQKNFLPHPYSDFIYAILVEEYGLFGGILILALYLGLLYRAISNITNTNVTYGQLLSIGIGFSLVLQAVINICVTVGLVPVTGIPLPFLSMGGTSLLFSGFSFGIMLNISRDLNEKRKPIIESKKSRKNEFR